MNNQRTNGRECGFWLEKSGPIKRVQKAGNELIAHAFRGDKEQQKSRR
jgi:hypothetical protein